MIGSLGVKFVSPHDALITMMTRSTTLQKSMLPMDSRMLHKLEFALYSTLIFSHDIPR